MKRQESGRSLNLTLLDVADSKPSQGNNPALIWNRTPTVPKGKGKAKETSSILWIFGHVSAESRLTSSPWAAIQFPTLQLLLFIKCGGIFKIKWTYCPEGGVGLLRRRSFWSFRYSHTENDGDENQTAAATAPTKPQPSSNNTVTVSLTCR